jgi:hypothetical protein
MTAIQTAAVAPLKVYIAGKITGDPEYKRKFLSAHMEQKNEGHIVLNPAHLPEGMKSADYMRICLAMIDSADLVAFLPGWESSAGARIEHEYCRYTGKRMKMLGETGDDN